MTRAWNPSTCHASLCYRTWPFFKRKGGGEKERAGEKTRARFHVKITVIGALKSCVLSFSLCCVAACFTLLGICTLPVVPSFPQFGCTLYTAAGTWASFVILMMWSGTQGVAGSVVNQGTKSSECISIDWKVTSKCTHHYLVLDLASSFVVCFLEVFPHLTHLRGHTLYIATPFYIATPMICVFFIFFFLNEGTACL